MVGVFERLVVVGVNMSESASFSHAVGVREREAEGVGSNFGFIVEPAVAAVSEIALSVREGAD